MNQIIYIELYVSVFYLVNNRDRMNHFYNDNVIHVQVHTATGNRYFPCTWTDEDGGKMLCRISLLLPHAFLCYENNGLQFRRAVYDVSLWATSTSSSIWRRNHPTANRGTFCIHGNGCQRDKRRKRHKRYFTIIPNLSQSFIN